MAIPYPARRTAYLLFLLAGASGLLFETLWTYQATLALGSSHWAVTAVLSAFMAGLAFGNLLSLRRAVWSLKTYAVLEAVILVTGLAALVLLPALGRILAPAFGALADHPLAVHLLRFVLAFGVLALPSTAMGMTLPALAQALGGEQGSFRAVLGRLYGLNTLGAIAGVLGAEVVLLPSVGVFGAGLVAALMNGIAALGAWKMAGRGAIADPPSGPAWDRRIPKALAPLFLAVFLAGFALLALEVVWTRFLALFIPNVSLSFALMLATVLAGISFGGIAGGAAWIRKPFSFLLLLGAGVAVVVCYSAFPLYGGAPEGLLKSPSRRLLAGGLLQFPVSFLSGAFFTIAGSELRERIASSQASTGLLVLFNTFGAAAGAVAAGALLVPGLGVERSFFVISLVYGLAAAAWFATTAGSRHWLAIGAAGWLAALALFPFGQFRDRLVPAAAARWAVQGGTTIETLREGRTETLVYLQVREFDRLLHHRMLSNAVSMSANTVGCDRYMKQFVYWPVALHPAPKRALLICFGVGSTARALTGTRELEWIDMVDLSRDVLELSGTVFPEAARHPLKDPRVRVHVEDGRFFLQTRQDSWDIITGEPPPPELPGVTMLYSREYFELLRSRLTEGGIATYWLPIHSLSEPAACSILKAWSEVFESCFLWRGSNRDLMMVGFRGHPRPATEPRFRAQWEDPATRIELIDVGFDVPEILGTGFIGDADYLRSIVADSAPTVDAHPKRIVAPGPDAKNLFESWFDVKACAARFGASAAIRDLWPPGIRERTVPLFEWEGTLTTVGVYPWKSRFPEFSAFHRLSTETPLKTAVLWVLGSDRDLLRAAERCDAETQRKPAVQFHLGARALAERDPARASDHFLRTVGVPGMRRIDLAITLYALCRAGRREEAERTLARVWDEARMKAIPAEYWSWMNTTFGLRAPSSR